MSDVEQRKLAWYAANRRLDAVQRLRAAEQGERRQAFERRLQVDLDAKYGEEERLAQAEHAAAVEALAEATEAAALAAVREVPLGSVMEEWRRIGYSSDNKPKRTGRVGVLEVITADSEHPSRASYLQASRGAVVIRLLKKDRTPSRSYISQSAEIKAFWRPAEPANAALDE